MARKAQPAGGYATGKDVAQRAGVSTITVSRVFNPAWEGKIRPETVERVRQVAQELNYRPNGVARSLVNRRTNIIAVVIGQSAGFFYSEILTDLVRRIQKSGRQALVFSLDLYDDVARILEQVAQHRVDAVVVTSSALRTDVMRPLEDMGMPVILFKRSAEQTNISGIWCDERQGALLAADCLLRTGCRQIGIVAHPHGGTGRAQAFAEELARQNITPIQTVWGDYSYESGQQAARRLLTDHQLDAIFCEEDTMAMACLDVAREEFGLRVPDDLAIIGFDNNTAAALPAYNITTVAHPIVDMLDALMEAIEQVTCDPHTPVRRQFEMSLLERSTTK